MVLLLPHVRLTPHRFAAVVLLIAAGCPAPQGSPDAGPKPAILTTIVGKNSAEYGFADGDPSTARLYWPEGLVLDGTQENLYIADTANHAIRKYNFASQQLSTVAGVGGMLGFRDTRLEDGGMRVALLNTPREMAMDPDGGSLWFTDTGNDVIRRLDLATFEVTTHFGVPGVPGGTDSDAGPALFGNQGLFNLWPGAILFSDAGTMFVSDGANMTIRAINMGSGEVTTLAGTVDTPGYQDGTGTNTLFNKPMGLAFDLTGGLIIAEANNIVLRRLDLTTLAVTTLAGKAPPAPNLYCEIVSPMQPRECGWVDAPKGLDARFRFPFGVAPDGQGGLYVVDSHNDVIRFYDMRTTAVSTVAGVQHTILEDADHASTDTSDTDPGTFWHPTHAVFQQPNILYVSDRSANCIRKVVLPR
jgi:DNA-binding beta-propeller fold protein YncE